MTASRFTSWATLLSAAFLLWACGSGEGGARCRVGDTSCGDPTTSPVVIEPQRSSSTSAGPLSCTLAIDKTETAANEERTLTVTGSGGYAPYHVDGIDFGTFSVSSIYKVKYPNTGTSKIYYSSKVRVVDNHGGATNCQVSVAVLPQTSTSPVTPTNPAGISCNLKISSANLNPRVGELVEFTAEASNGSGTYVWDNFYAGNGFSYQPTVDGANKVKVSTAYSKAGNYLAVIPVSNTVNGTTSRAQCQVIVPIRQVSLVATPAGTQEAVSEMSFGVEMFGFDPKYPPTFSASLGDSTNLVATVTPEAASGRAQVVVRRTSSTDKAERLSSITITASNSTSGDTVQLTKNLKFLTSDIRCDVQVTGSLLVNTDIHIKVTSPDVNDLHIDNLSNSPDGTANLYTWYGWNDILAKYPSVGTKVVKFKAYSPSRGNAYCNNGTFFEKNIEVKSSLSACSVTTNPNLSAVGQVVNVQGAILTDGLANNYTVTVTTVGGNSVPYGSAVGLNQSIIFNAIGTFDVNMKIRDNYGTEVACTTKHSVVGAYGIFRDSYTLWDEDKGFGLTADWNFLPGWSEWFRSNYKSYVASEIVSTIDIARTESRAPFSPQVGKAGWFALVHHGSILIQELGCYQFQIGSDDGAILLLDGAPVDVPGITTTNFSGLTGYRYGTSRQVCFTQASQLGLHRFILKYYNGPQGAYGLNLSWKTPSNPTVFTTIPAWHYIQAW